jgi:hypothetical protein
MTSHSNQVTPSGCKWTTTSWHKGQEPTHSGRPINNTNESIAAVADIGLQRRLPATGEALAI